MIWQRIRKIVCKLCCGCGDDSDIFPCVNFRIHRFVSTSIVLFCYISAMSHLLNGTHVSFAYNKASMYSSVSAHLAERLWLSVHHGYCSASVSVPTIDSVFTSILRFVVIPDLGCEIVLGSDWIGLCRAVTTDGLTMFPPSSPESSHLECRTALPCMSTYFLVLVYANLYLCNYDRHCCAGDVLHVPDTSCKHTYNK